mgnify:CR=1 FL=1
MRPYGGENPCRNLPARVRIYSNGFDGSGLGGFFLFGAAAGLFPFAARLAALFRAFAFLGAFPGALFIFLAALLGCGGGGVRRSGCLLGVTVDTEGEREGCYSEDLFHIMRCEVCGVGNAAAEELPLYD